MKNINGKKCNKEPPKEKSKTPQNPPNPPNGKEKGLSPRIETAKTCVKNHGIRKGAQMHQNSKENDMIMSRMSPFGASSPSRIVC